MYILALFTIKEYTRRVVHCLFPSLSKLAICCFTVYKIEERVKDYYSDSSKAAFSVST